MVSKRLWSSSYRSQSRSLCFGSSVTQLCVLLKFTNRARQWTKGLGRSTGIAVSIRRAIRPDGREFTRLTLRIQRDLDNLRHNSTSVTIAQLNVAQQQVNSALVPGKRPRRQRTKNVRDSPRTGRGHRGDQNCHRRPSWTRNTEVGRDRPLVLTGLASLPQPAPPPGSPGNDLAKVATNTEQYDAEE